MTELTLPKHINGEYTSLCTHGQITLVGNNGAGKTRFMQEMKSLVGAKAFQLNAIGADFPEIEEDLSEGSVDSLYQKAVDTQPYLRSDAVSVIDKLVYMLFIDEFKALLSMKNDNHRLAATKLDRIRALWETLFPGNRIIISDGRLMFATSAGEDLIPASKLSQGEKTIFFYMAGVLYAMPEAIIFIDSPSLFIHRSILNNVWNAIEQLRPDCTFVYDSVDEDFVSSRSENACIWIKSYQSRLKAWDYELMYSGHYNEELFIDLIGTRKPVLFIEGDSNHSIDIKLYSLVFPEYTVKPLGSCEKVIESTRTFNDLMTMHHLDSHGIVDRDRRTDKEVDYLRRKNILVPQVAEVENIFLSEQVVKAMARLRGKDPEKVFIKVKKALMKNWKIHYREQALQHVRHRIKREVEHRIDGRFNCITALETHLRNLIDTLQPRQTYEELLNEFSRMLTENDYAGILKVFNYKPMLGESNVARLLGYPSKDAYIAGVINVLKGGGKAAQTLLSSVRYILDYNIKSPSAHPESLSHKKC